MEVSTSEITYIYKDRRGEYFAVHYAFIEKSVFVCQITVTESNQLNLVKILRREQLEQPSHYCPPFIEDEALFYFSGESNQNLVKLSFNGTNSSNISLNSATNSPKSNISLRLPVYFDGCIIYCTVNTSTETHIWALNPQQFCWSLKATVHHHNLLRTSYFYEYFCVLSDGSAFLQTFNCTICPNTSHLYQFDLSISGEHIISDKELGKGGFGIVMEGKLSDQRKTAVKILHDFSALSILKKRKILLTAISEANKLKSLSHPNIVKGYGFKIEENRFLLFMELMEESVRQKILKTLEKRLVEEEAFRILQQTLEGLVYLHTFKPKPIVHRDIKCANILLDGEGQAKLGDFGLLKAVSLNTLGTTNLALAPNDSVGTHYWQAPEVLDDGSAYGRRADVWSIGCTVVEMLTGYPPYVDMTVPKWTLGLNSGKLEYRPHQLVPGASQDVINILEKCFRRQTKKENAILASINELIRPHSWELLADVVNVNELRPAEERAKLIEREVEVIRAKIAKIRATDRKVAEDDCI